MSFRTAKVAFCVKCNQERPLRKTYANGTNGRKGSRIYVCTACWERVELPNKFKSVPTRSKIDGRLFHSKKEAGRQPALVALQNSGQIRDLRYQGPDFAFRVYSTGPVEALLFAVNAIANGTFLDGVHGPGGRDQLRRAMHDVERSMVTIPGKYRPDFTYHTPDNVLHVEDVKGARLIQYRRNKALMLACFGIEVEEPEEGGIQQRARGCGVSGKGTGARLMGGR